MGGAHHIIPLLSRHFADTVTLPRSADSTDGADADGVKEYFSCLQWDCEPGHYSSTLPNCYQEYLLPTSSDDFRAEESDVEECSNDTCCEETGQKWTWKICLSNKSSLLICELEFRLSCAFSCRVNTYIVSTTVFGLTHRIMYETCTRA